MIQRVKVLIGICLFCMHASIAQTDKIKSEIVAIDQQIEIAVANEDYETASNLKKKKELYIQMESAVESEDYTKAAELKKEIEGLEAMASQPNKNVKQNSVSDAETNNGRKYIENGFGIYEYDISFNEKESSELEAKRFKGEYIEQIGISQGLEIGYLLSTDEFLIGNDVVVKNHDITLTLINRTGVKLVFDHFEDVLCHVKFSGERVTYQLRGELKEKTGGKCPFYAGFLSVENGKYVMQPNEVYSWKYTINQDAESMVDKLLQRRLKPIWIETFSTKPGLESSFPVYPEINLSAFPISLDKKGRYYQRVEIPNTKIHVTWAQKNIVLNEQLKRNGDYLNLYENGKIKIEVAIIQPPAFDQSLGLYLYSTKLRITNKMDKMLDVDGLQGGAIGTLYFCNSYSLKLRVTNKSFQGDGIAWKDLEPHQVFECEESFYMEPYTGEYFFNGKYISRSEEHERQLIPEYIKLSERVFLDNSELGSTTKDGKTKIHVLIHPDNKLGSSTTMLPYNFLFGNNLNSAMSSNERTHLTFEFNQGGKYEFYIVRGEIKNQKTLVNAKAGKTKGMLSVQDCYEPIDIDSGQELFYYFDLRFPGNYANKQMTKIEFDETLKQFEGINTRTVVYE